MTLIGMKQTLGNATSGACQVQNFLNEFIKSIPVSARSTSRPAHKAQEVFSTAELAEAILLHLDVVDILSAVQVNHTTSRLISSSPRLQELLHLRASKKGHLKSPFHNNWPLTDLLNVRIFHSEPRPGRTTPQGKRGAQKLSEVRIDAIFHGEGRYRRHQSSDYETISELPKIGSMARRMLVCQPPVKAMKVSISCCAVSEQLYRRSSNALDDVPSVISMSGLTVGGLHDAAVKTKAEHKYCPNARLDQHCRDGTVDVLVTFH